MPAAASELATQRTGFERALEVAEKRPLADFSAAARPYANHPLAPYLDYVALRRQLEHISAESISEFLDRHPTVPIAATLRTEALRAFAKRRDWAGFRKLYTGSNDVTLRCADLLSRQSTPPTSDWLDAGLVLWLSGGSQPTLCDSVFQTLRAAGTLTPARYMERIELAAAQHNLGLIRYLARALPEKQAAQALGYVSYLQAPTEKPTAAWPADQRNRNIALLGIHRVAKQDPGAAEALLSSLQDRLAFDATQRGAALNQIALWSAASYLPDSDRRFANVPADAWDERLHEWQTREALARGDELAALAAIKRMPEAQRTDSRWRYFEARLRERQGDKTARLTFEALANEPTYFGFLAADRINAPYALCPLDADADGAARERLHARDDFVRTMELHAIGRISWARREWEALRSTLSEDERRTAVALADAAGWHERGAFTLNSGEDLRYYRLRFPLPHQNRLLREAKKYQLDPAWIAALIRAESAWAPDARSHANARGLMQLLPSTAQMEAKKRQLRYPGDARLFNPRDNLTLGIAHLDSMLERHGGQPFLATAAYNAGPTPVARWLAQRPPSEIDLWIETIPYKETREYVARILAFAAIYDWRMHGTAIPVSARAKGQAVATSARRSFVCPAPARESAI